MSNGMRLYFLFALIAIGVNLAMQKVTFLVYEYFFAGIDMGIQWLTIMVNDKRFPLYMAMAVGTGSSLILKFFLDRKFVFDEKPKGLKGDALTFAMYAGMGLITTFIFWAVELGFDFFIHTEWSKYLGAAIGLTIGYTTKYFLDKKFVFQKAPEAL